MYPWVQTHGLNPFWVRSIVHFEPKMGLTPVGKEDSICSNKRSYPLLKADESEIAEIHVHK